MFRNLILLATIAAVAAGGCDNACSGHGICGERGICQCHDNWGMGLGHDSGDCSQRICPYEFAWVDTPDKLGNHHRYAECANRGICDRDTAECACFPGYEGKACARTTCPNDCSGHGQCDYIENLPYASTPNDFSEGSFLPQDAHTFSADYHKWDHTKTRGCICDPEYGDVDCSKRMCMYGTDVMDQRNNMLSTANLHTQHIQFQADQKNTLGIEGHTFALTFRSKLNETFTTIPIVMNTQPSANPNTGSGVGKTFHDFVKDVEYALESLPNRVIDNVDVAGSIAMSNGPVNGLFTDSLTTTTDKVYLNITFSGENVQGPQHLLTVKHILCGDGCTPKLTGLELHTNSMNVTEITMSDYNSFECGRRGKCDYSTGICQCFSGYTGLACNTITSLV